MVNLPNYRSDIMDLAILAKLWRDFKIDLMRDSWQNKCSLFYWDQLITDNLSKVRDFLSYYCWKNNVSQWFEWSLLWKHDEEYWERVYWKSIIEYKRTFIEEYALLEKNSFNYKTFWDDFKPILRERTIEILEENAWTWQERRKDQPEDERDTWEHWDS